MRHRRRDIGVKCSKTLLLNYSETTLRRRTIAKYAKDPAGRDDLKPRAAKRELTPEAANTFYRVFASANVSSRRYT
jgi:hypothetical protein